MQQQNLFKTPMSHICPCRTVMGLFFGAACIYIWLMNFFIDSFKIFIKHIKSSQKNIEFQDIFGKGGQ